MACLLIILFTASGSSSTARKLEDFISLIETAEKISCEEVSQKTVSVVVPRLSLASLSTCNSPPPNFVGPKDSHCGLTFSSRPPSSRPRQSSGQENKKRDSSRPESSRQGEGTDRSDLTQRETSRTTNRRGSFSIPTTPSHKPGVSQVMRNLKI